MKTVLTATTLGLFLLGSGAAFATGCHNPCGEGFTYSTESKSCVPKTVGS